MLDALTVQGLFWGDKWKELVVFCKAAAMKQSCTSAVAASLCRMIKLSKKQCKKPQTKQQRKRIEERFRDIRVLHLHEESWGTNRTKGK